MELSWIQDYLLFAAQLSGCTYIEEWSIRQTCERNADKYPYIEYLPIYICLEYLRSIRLWRVDGDSAAGAECTGC